MSKACSLVEVVSLWCRSLGMRSSKVRYEIGKGRLGEETIRLGRLVSQTSFSGGVVQSFFCWFDPCQQQGKSFQP